MKKAHRARVEEQKKALAEVFHDAGWNAKSILQDMSDSKNFYCERLGLVKLDSWFHGNVPFILFSSNIDSIIYFQQTHITLYRPLFSLERFSDKN